jgi:HTH-type transcriptional regulator, sugar sensing transcriptional regulator
MLNSQIEPLVALGLNQLEAETYALLLGGEPMTGYRIGKVLGRPTANVYKAIESLARRGAVLMTEGENRLCRAVPSAEFLRHTQASLDETVRRAEEALSDSGPPAHDERIYELQSVPLVEERFRGMLERCTAIAVVDAFPAPLARVADSLIAAARRGIAVHLLTYKPFSLPGVNVVVTPVGREVVEHWNSHQLNLVTDSRECLLSLLQRDLARVHQAIWSESLYLSAMLHAGMMREQVFHRIWQAQDAPDALEKIRQILSEQVFFHNSEIPGQRALLARFQSRAARR